MCIKFICLAVILTLVNAEIEEPDLLCSLPKDLGGKCLVLIKMFFYNTESQQCEQFVARGCGGNANRFRTREACEQRCGARAVRSEVCSLPPAAGPCKAYVPLFYHKNGQCLEFIYGGCMGNGNKFNTIDECQTTCF